MAQLVVRDLEEDVKKRLQRRAKRHGRSMEAEIRDILRNAVSVSDEQAQPFGTRFASRFAGIGLDETVVEISGYPATPANFDE